MNHPHQHIAKLMGEADEFVLTKRSWDGYSSGRGDTQQWEFAVLDAGPEWLRIQAKYNGSCPVTPDNSNGQPRWITWKDFGSFGVKVDGVAV